MPTPLGVEARLRWERSQRQSRRPNATKTVVLTGDIKRIMHCAGVLLLASIWIAANFFLWSLKQSHLALFLQSLGMGAIAYPALYYYVTRRR
jgi:hypothetical protein